MINAKTDRAPRKDNEEAQVTGKYWNGNGDLQWEAGGMQPGGTKVTS